MLTGLTVIETGDLLGGGTSDKFHNATVALKKRFDLEKWVELSEKSAEYGGRTLHQAKDFSFTIAIFRYLRDRARKIQFDH